MANKTIIINVRVDEKTNEKLEEIAAKKDIKKSELLRETIEKLIKKNK